MYEQDFSTTKDEEKPFIQLIDCTLRVEFLGAEIKSLPSDNDSDLNIVLTAGSHNSS
jgi:hypothetical protein